jgi:hypothetical protein
MEVYTSVNRFFFQSRDEIIIVECETVKPGVARLGFISVTNYAGLRTPRQRKYRAKIRVGVVRDKRPQSDDERETTNTKDTASAQIR